MDEHQFPFELIAQGPHLDHRWRRRLPADGTVELGRATTSFRVPWDAQVSRRHVEMTVRDTGLQVTKVPQAKNPVFRDGQKVSEFLLKPGQHFVIGNTSFTLSQHQAEATLDLPDPIHQKSFSPEFLNQVRFNDAEQRIDVLSRLPDLISSAGDQSELLNRLVNTLFAGIQSASKIGIVRLNQPLASMEETSTEPRSSTTPVVSVVFWDHRRKSGRISLQNPSPRIVPDLKAGKPGDANEELNFQPSETLIQKSVETGETVLHIWQPNLEQLSEYTFDSENDWAFSCPIHSAATPGWCIYVAGSQEANFKSGNEEPLQGDIKFCELVGTTLKNLLLVNQLERRQASFRGFFSPVVMEAMSGHDPDQILEPRECELSVIFCDLRGFVKTTESMADELFRLLDHVSRSLEVVTRQILDHSGVIGDFHGDAVMGFWGWPFSAENSATSAIRTALAIKSEFMRREPNLTHLPVGIGVATGLSVAGKIGTRDQVKVTALGPAVNLASRLESMNRQLNTSILLDQSTWNLHQQGSSNIPARFRSLGRFQPIGIFSPVEVFQLHDANDPKPVQDEVLTQFAIALERFQAGEWEMAKSTLEELAAEDRTAQYFLNFISSLQQPPEDWRGVIQLGAK